MDAITLCKMEIQWAHDLLEMTMEDVVPELASWRPPGVANPLGAQYAHAVLAEDGVIQRVLKGERPLYETSWIEKTGVSIPEMHATPEWARGVQVELGQLRQYAQAVYANTFEYLDSLSAEQLDQELDLTADGMGVRTIGWAIGVLVPAHVHNMAGEISCLKGIQGVRGYPF